MYAYFRTIYYLGRKPKPLDSVWETSTLDMRVWPGDMDIFFELNNGRYLTLMDFGRFDYFRKLGWMGSDHNRKWSGAVAGASIRYRKRLKLMQRFRLTTRLVGLDDRWWYFGQTFERNGTLHASGLVRFAVTDNNGLIPIDHLEEVLEMKLERKMPDWVKAWDTSDQMRPWVPMQDLEDD